MLLRISVESNRSAPCDTANVYADMAALFCETDTLTFSISSEESRNALDELADALQSKSDTDIQHAQITLYEDSDIRVIQIDNRLRILPKEEDELSFSPTIAWLDRDANLRVNTMYNNKRACLRLRLATTTCN